VADRAEPDAGPGEAPPGGAVRVLSALRYLAGQPNGARLIDIAHGLGLPRSSAHRALAPLIQSGFARQDHQGLYHVGFELLRLVFSYQDARAPSLLVGPLLQRLAAETGETAHYGVLEGDRIVYQAKVSSSGDGLRMSSVIGGSNPAYRTGIGKALLMHRLRDLDAVREYVAATGPLEARTPNTITTPEALHAALAEGREQGYLLDREENDLGVVCIALPLFLDSPSRPTGAISVSAVATRTDLDSLVAQLPRIHQIVVDELGSEVLVASEPHHGG